MSDRLRNVHPQNVPYLYAMQGRGRNLGLGLSTDEVAIGDLFEDEKQESNRKNKPFAPNNGYQSGCCSPDAV